MTEPEKKTFQHSTRSTFITGIFFLVPLAITYWVLDFLVQTTSNIASPYVLAGFRWLSDEPAPPFLVGFCSFVLVVCFIFLFGWLTSFYLGKKFLELIDLAMLRLPFIRSIYGGTKQIIEAFSLQNKSSFKKVVMVEYPRNGAWVYGFVTSEDLEHTQGLSGLPMVAVFIPSIPNPTTGFLVYYDPRDIILLGLSIEDGVKIIVSAGLVMPKPSHPPIRLSDHMELHQIEIP